LENELANPTNVENLTIYVNIIIPRESAILESNIENVIPFLYIKVPITIPNNPVVKQKIKVSSILNKISKKTDEKNTVSPRDTLITAAIAIRRELNGLKAKPSIGKNRGAD